MSTIAYRDGIIAADTLASTNYKTMEGVRKVGRTNKFLFGLAGRYANIHRVYHWIKEIENECSPHDFYKHSEKLDASGLDCTVILVEENGIIWTMQDDGNVCQVFSDYEATGSGQEFALGAMHAGASAEDAIKAASKFDAHTGGVVINTVSFSDIVHSPTD